MSRTQRLPKIIVLAISLFIQLYSLTVFADPLDAIQLPNLSTDEQKLAYLLMISDQKKLIFQVLKS